MDKDLAKYRAERAQKFKENDRREKLLGFFKPPEWLTCHFNNILKTEFNFSTWILILKVLLWLILWKIFILMEFGTVFFMLSMFYWVYSSMKAGTRKPWEPSAYSVFNKDFETLEGTFTAEQFERELKYGAGALKD